MLLGASGLLGSAVLEATRAEAPVCVGRARLDVREPQRLATIISDVRPDIIVNCAAHTNVDAAESDPASAFTVNAMLPSLVAQSARRVDAVLVHYSSTGCYGSQEASAHTEEDLLRPLTVHHRSKVAGEEAVRASGCRHLILRTGWLFGGGVSQPKNFVWKRLVEARKVGRMVSDGAQRGNPTYVGDVARQTLALLQAGVGGTFNCVSAECASRYDYVTEIVRAAELPCQVERSTAPFNRLAPVAMNETAVNWRLGLIGMDQMPPWRASLETYIDALKRTPAWRSLAGD